MDSAGKKVSQKWTVARAATAGPCCSCQRDSLAAGKLLALTENKPPALLNDDDPGAHGNERGQSTMKQNGRGQSKLEWGQDVDGQWVWQAKMAAGTQPAEQQLQATPPAEQGNSGNSASGFSARLRPQRNTRTAHSWPALQQKQLPDDVGLSPCR